ncbi:MAG TPA: aminoacyl-tRNA hydrolase [Verrucomicrobiae bacterium]
MFLIAGLGNPGPDYAATRHNIGFAVVERLADQWSAVWNTNKRFNARLAKAERDGRKVTLCQPQTFMNASGEAVAAVSRFYQLPPDKVLVVLDDADLPLGQLRLRADGSCGGHHGLESVEKQMGTRAYPRLRIGIGRRRDDDREIADYVLGRFAAAERPVVQEVVDRACRQVECWLTEGIQAAMNRFNGAVSAPPDKANQG